MAEDEREVDGSTLFSVSVRNYLFGGVRGLKDVFRVKTRPRPVYLIGRDVTTDTQTLDSIIDTSGRLRVGLLAGAVPSASEFQPNQSNWPSPPEATIEVAGNVGIAIITPGALGSSRPVWVIEGIRYSYLCSATAGARTTAPPLVDSAMTRVTGGGQPDVSLVDTLSLTAGQEGSVAAASNGVRVKNQNGTFTFTAGGSPCPWTVEAFTASVAAATGGLATDLHRLTLLVRQVA